MNPSLSPKTTPTKVSHNSDAVNGEPGAEETESEIEAEEEMEDIEDTGKSSNYQGYLKFKVQETWDTGPDAVLDDTYINNQIYQRMKKFMDDSRLLKAPGHRPKPTDIGLWKQYCEPYFNSRTEETIRPFKRPMYYRCRCKTKVRLCTGKNYKRLEFHEVHHEHSHEKEIKTKKLNNK